MRFRLTVLALLAASPAFAQTPITLDQAMAHPDWIGPPVESAWWAWDGKHVHYTLKRAGSPLRDTYVQAVDGGERDARRGRRSAPTSTPPQPVYDRDRSRMVFVRNGDVFVRDLRSGALAQLTRSTDGRGTAAVSRPTGAACCSASATTGSAGTRPTAWWRRWRCRGPRRIRPPRRPSRRATRPAAAPDRHAQAPEGTSARRNATQAEALRKADPTRAPAPMYLGDDVQIDDSALSPDGRWLLVVTSPKGADAGRAGKMPKYVTESGYEEFEDVRTRVGRNLPVGAGAEAGRPATAARCAIWRSTPCPASAPIRWPRCARPPEARSAERQARRARATATAAARRSAGATTAASAAVMLRAIDNKDRWIATRRSRQRHACSRASADRCRVDQLELQRLRLAARQPHALVPVRGNAAIRTCTRVAGGKADGADVAASGKPRRRSGRRDGSDRLLPLQPRSGRATTKSAR